MEVLSTWEIAAREFEPRSSRVWASPLDLACALDPRYRRTPALELINEALVWADSTPDARLIVVMSPQEGKSLLVSQHGVLWSLLRDPRKRIAEVSYGDSLARRWGRAVRNHVRDHGAGLRIDLGLRLAPDKQAANEWELTTGGGMITAGVHTGLTGRPVDDLRIDDPLKDRDEADSPTIRQNVWEFWTGTAVPRLAPGAPVILVMTRWHHDDLAGRLMRDQPGQWRVVHIPAQADPDVVDPDPLGRAPGEYMVSARGRTPADWERRKVEMEADWEPLAQGNPASPGGDVFDVDKLRWWHRSADGTELVCGPRTWRLADCWRFVTVDTATSTRSTADWTVASAWAVPLDGSIVLLDSLRERVPEHRQIDVARPLVERWGCDPVYVEASMRGTQLVRDAIAQGWRIEDLHPDTNKRIRAGLAARRVDQGRLWFPGDMDPAKLRQRVDELKEFPHGRHDDFVDTLAYAAHVALTDWIPPTTPAVASPVRTAADQAGLAQVGDLMHQLF